MPVFTSVISGEVRDDEHHEEEDVVMFEDKDDASIASYDSIQNVGFKPRVDVPKETILLEEVLQQEAEKPSIEEAAFVETDSKSPKPPVREIEFVARTIAPPRKEPTEVSVSQKSSFFSILKIFTDKTKQREDLLLASCSASFDASSLGKKKSEEGITDTMRTADTSSSLLSTIRTEDAGDDACDYSQDDDDDVSELGMDEDPKASLYATERAKYERELRMEAVWERHEQRQQQRTSSTKEEEAILSPSLARDEPSTDGRLLRKKERSSRVLLKATKRFAKSLLGATSMRRKIRSGKKKQVDTPLQNNSEGTVSSRSSKEKMDGEIAV